MEEHSKRRLAAIVAADVAGYSRLVGQDEEAAIRSMRAHRSEFIEPLLAQHGGRIANTAGDSLLLEFPSVADAVRCSVSLQRGMAERNANLPQDDRIEFRIGINLGDVIDDEGDLLGDGVNIAARLESMAEPGGICLSRGARDQIRDRLDVVLEDMGEVSAKNIARPVRAFRIVFEPSKGTSQSSSPRRTFRKSIVGLTVLALVIVGITTALWLEDLLPRGVMPSVDKIATPSAEGPSIAVLPFENLAASSEWDYFSDGVSGDVISALSRFSNIIVMSWNAVAPFRDQGVTPAQLSKLLDVRYVVTGTIQREATRIRVSVQLTDATRGRLLWSDRYDRPIGDVFQLQDEITQQIVAALAVKVSNLESKRAAAKPTEHLAAYDLTLRARDNLRRRSRETNFLARSLFQEAIEVDPDYTAAYIGLGTTFVNDMLFGWTEWPTKTAERARELALKAIELDPQNSRAHSLLGTVYLHTGELDLAQTELDRAVELNPNDPEILASFGMLAVRSGRVRESIEPLETARRFDPDIDPGWADLGTAYFVVGRNEDAIATLKRGLAGHPDRVYAQIVLTAALADAGNLDEAKLSARAVLRLYPFFEIKEFSRYSVFSDPQDRDRVTAALRKAGLD